MNSYNDYLNDLFGCFWSFFDKHNWPMSVLDKKNGCDRTKRPVFLKEHQDLNLIIDPKVDRKKIDALAKQANSMDDDMHSPLDSGSSKISHHRWFRSMNSSQALAISFFGNLRELGCVSALMDVKDDNGALLFEGLTFDSGMKLELEKEADWLHEQRKTSLDACLSDDKYRIAIECKLIEKSIGICSRPKEKKHSKEYCDGSYCKPKKIDPEERCVLTALKIPYWTYIPALFKWSSKQDYVECPLRDTYQLVRNILAAAVNREKASSSNGHAVLIYDERNPNFRHKAEKCSACKYVSDALLEKKMLRTCSWQALLKQLKDVPAMAFVLDEISMKYGLC